MASSPESGAISEVREKKEEIKSVGGKTRVRKTQELETRKEKICIFILSCYEANLHCQ
jgi:hypothetical protein